MRKLMNKKSLLALSVSTLLIAGCANNKPDDFEKYNKNATDLAREDVKSAEEFMEMKENFDLDKPEFGKLINDYYVPQRSVDSIAGKERQDLPIEFRKNILFITKEVPLRNTVSKINDLTDVKISFPYKSMGGFSGQGYSINDTQSLGSTGIPGQGVLTYDENGNPIPQNIQGNRNNLDREAFNSEEVLSPKLKFNGSLEELLDKMAIYYDLKWKYDSNLGQVFFYKYETATFFVYSSRKSVNSQTSISTDTTGEGGGDETGSSSTATSSSIEINEESDNWQELQDSVNNIVGDRGEVSFFKQQRKVLVTAPDGVLADVSSFLDSVNKDAQTQVVMQVSVKNVLIEDNNTVNMNLSYINNSITGRLAEITGLTSFTIEREGVETPGSVSIGASSDNKTDVAGDVLATFGTVNNTTEQSFIVKNNQTFPIQITTNETYVAEVSIQTNQTNSNASVETDEVMDGVTFNITPSVIGNQIEIELKGSLSTNDGIREISVGSSQNSADGGAEQSDLVTLGLPTVSRKNIYQEFIIANGVPKAVSIIKKSNTETEKSGPISPWAWFFGGSNSKQNKEEYLVVTVTAYINR